MSLFTVGEWWSAIPGASEQCGGGCVAVANLDNAADGAMKVAIGALLCEFTLFDKAHQLLRASLLKKYGDEIKSFTNEEIHNRVNPRIREHFYGFLSPEVPPEVVTRMKQYREGEKIFRKVLEKFILETYLIFLTTALRSKSWQS